MEQLSIKAEWFVTNVEISGDNVERISLNVEPLNSALTPYKKACKKPPPLFTRFNLY